MMVKSNCWDCIFFKCTIGNRLYKCSFSSIL